MRGGDALLAAGGGYGAVMDWPGFVTLYAGLCNLSAPSLDPPQVTHYLAPM